MLEKTLSIIKPDAMKCDLADDINKLITKNGLQIVVKKKLHMSMKMAAKFYEVHKERPFYNDLVVYMSSGLIQAQVLSGGNAVQKYRDLMGATNPKEAAEGTIRQLYALDIEKNSVHGSDSQENALREIQFFFATYESEDLL